MLCFERGAGSKALRKPNLIMKQLYKICKLDLFLKGKALNKENLAKVKNLFYIFCFCHIL